MCMLIVKSVRTVSAELQSYPRGVDLEKFHFMPVSVLWA